MCFTVYYSACCTHLTSIILCSASAVFIIHLFVWIHYRYYGDVLLVICFRLLQVLPKDVPTEEKRDQTDVTSDRKVTSPDQQEHSGSVESHANGEQTEREREYASNSHEYYPSIPAVVDGSDRYATLQCVFS